MPALIYPILRAAVTWRATNLIAAVLLLLSGHCTSQPLHNSTETDCIVTFHDQFRALSLVPDPICPAGSQPIQHPDEFLSFEAWKSLRLEEAPVPPIDKATGHPAHNQHFEGVLDAPSSSPASTSTNGDEHVQLAPLRVPLTDRFNYAAVDCSARIDSASKSSKSPSAILSPKRDKYMLSPCSTTNKFVIVELCDDIQIGKASTIWMRAQKPLFYVHFQNRYDSIGQLRILLWSVQRYHH